MTKISTLLRTNFITLIRQRTLLASGLGLTVISMLVFGFIMSGNGVVKTVIGVVDQDHSTISAQALSKLQKSNSLQVYTGTYDQEQQALKDAQRNAVIVLRRGFGEKLATGGASIQVFYDQSNPVTAATTKLVVQAIVDDINRTTRHQPGSVIIDQQAISVKESRVIDFVTPGLIGLQLMWANIAVSVELITWRERGITRRLAATPLKPISMVSSQVVARLALSMVQVALLLALAIWIFNVHIYGNFGLLALVVTLGTLTMLAIGFALASFVKKSEQANGIMMLVSFLMMFLGGSYFNVNGVPSFLQPVIHMMPLYYLNDALRQVINNGAGWGTIQTSMLVMVAWIAASMLVVWRAFKWL
jgi:ABC-2 type transport system permease protein